MELGGKNAMLVCADADLNPDASPGAVRAAFSNTGQLCIAAERIYVVDQDLGPLRRPRFIDATKALRLGHALDYTHDMGTLISARQLETVTRHVDDALGKGATLLAGGRTTARVGPLLPRTDDRHRHNTRHGRSLTKETFGPVVSLYRVASVQEAVARANHSRYGLSFSVWTSRRPSPAGRLAQHTRGRTTSTSTRAHAAAWGSVDAPMGGMEILRSRPAATASTGSRNTRSRRRSPPSGCCPSAPRRGLRADRYARVMTDGLRRALRRIPGVRQRHDAGPAPAGRRGCSREDSATVSPTTAPAGTAGRGARAVGDGVLPPDPQVACEQPGPRSEPHCSAISSTIVVFEPVDGSSRFGQVGRGRRGG